MEGSPVVIVLAAGAGSRFAGDGHKLTQSFADSTVLGTTVSHAVRSGLPVRVVTTAALQPRVLEWLPAQHVVVVPPAGDSPEAGIGYSIAAGVRANGDAPGWLVLPGDMPLVQPPTLRAVADALVDHPVAYAQHEGKRGHPVGFAGELFSELARLTGDDGARRIVARYPAVAVNVQDRGVLLDLDTLDDLQLLQELHVQGHQTQPRAEAARADQSMSR
ncbi:MAG TPA: nucleotidyltransferase family protein [Burkholderiaceae bacterium]|nr:nucleotidyltransferase family protein [Burkholderiaceae bacterium]